MKDDPFDILVPGQIEKIVRKTPEELLRLRAEDRKSFEAEVWAIGIKCSAKLFKKNRKWDELQSYLMECIANLLHDEEKADEVLDWGAWIYSKLKDMGLAWLEEQKHPLLNPREHKYERPVESDDEANEPEILTMADREPVWDQRDDDESDESRQLFEIATEGDPLDESILKHLLDDPRVIRHDSQEEIARLHGVSQKTVSYRLQRMENRLKDAAVELPWRESKRPFGK